MEKTTRDQHFEERLEALHERLAVLRKAIGRSFLGHREAVDLLLNQPGLMKLPGYGTVVNAAGVNP